MIITHSVAIGTILYAISGSTTPETNTLVFAVIYYCVTATGVTAGYHRLWSHEAYDASPLLELGLMAGASGALQGSAIWWSRLHRAHHRYTDTDDDPYDSRRGFFFAHMGWMFFKKSKVPAGISVKDLKQKSALTWQNRNFVWFGPFMAFLFPGIVAHIGWNDFRGGLLWAGFVRLFLLYHATWCVNSVAHYFGDQPFDDTLSARNNILNAFVTMGEGYHNFHHEFPNDFRNGIRWWQYDPTKWLIAAMDFFGLAYNLKRFPDKEIEICEARTRYIQSSQALQRLVGSQRPAETLPIWSTQNITDEASKGKSLVIIDGVVHDVTTFKKHHPGGTSIIDRYEGKDATEAFNGGVYNHTNAARQILSNYRVARYVPDTHKKK